MWMAFQIPGNCITYPCGRLIESNRGDYRNHRGEKFAPEFQLLLFSLSQNASSSHVECPKAL